MKGQLGLKAGGTLVHPDRCDHYDVDDGDEEEEEDDNDEDDDESDEIDDDNYDVKKGREDEPE